MKKSGGLRHTWTQSPGPAEYAARGWVEAKPTLPKGWRVVGMPPPAQNADVEASAFDGLDLNDNPSAGPAAIGINIVRFREATGRWTDAPIDVLTADLVDLGVTFVRQPAADLCWPHNGKLPVVIPRLKQTKFGTYDLDPLRAIFRANLFPGMPAMFDAFDPAGIDVILTVLSLGQAGLCTADADPLHELEANSVPFWLWDPSHLGATVSLAPSRTADFNDVESIVTGNTEHLVSGFSAQRNWLLSSMDIRSPYKRQYMMFMAQAACEVLLEVDAATKLPALPRVVGIELFNEINLTCRTTSPADTCAAWAKCVKAALRGVNNAFAAAGKTLPPLGLPSFGGPSDATPWGMAGSTDSTSVLYFLQTFLSVLKAELGTLDAFATLDIHWYHYERKHDAARPGACIVQDVRETKRVLRTADSQAEVTMCETGVPAWSGRSGIDYSAFPVLINARTPAELNSFQAREIWRHVGVGLASGAKRIAWHTHRALPGGGSAGCGLRDDDSSFRLPPNEFQRPSWGAYQRVFERLLGSGVATSSARLLWPTHATYGPDFSGLARLKGLDMTLVVEVAAPGGRLWCYLAMIDSIAEQGGNATPTPESTLTLAPVGWKSGGTPFPLSSWGTLPTVGTSTSARGAYADATFQWSTGADPVRTLNRSAFVQILSWGAPPVLIASTRQLTAHVSA